MLKKAMLYVHGKGGEAAEGQAYRKNCAGFEIVGVPYRDSLPWLAQGQIQKAYDALRPQYESIWLLASSIGAYFSMLALPERDIEKALFLSPVLDMERLIQDMMRWAGVSEQELCQRGQIPTDFGETLSWDYLCYVRRHPVRWSVPTHILYGSDDQLIARSTVDDFLAHHTATLTVMPGGEHWFHTPAQTAFLDRWMKQAVASPGAGKEEFL